MIIVNDVRITVSYFRNVVSDENIVVSYVQIL